MSFWTPHWQLERKLFHHMACLSHTKTFLFVLVIFLPYIFHLYGFLNRPATPLTLPSAFRFNAILTFDMKFPALYISTPCTAVRSTWRMMNTVQFWRVTLVYAYKHEVYICICYVCVERNVPIGAYQLKNKKKHKYN